MSNITEEIKKRRTFAIISHPDAGKTTLTEKFLLYGGAINLAGTVKMCIRDSFGSIGVFAIPEMKRFYRHVLIEGNFPHHGAVAFGHYGKALYEVFKYVGVDVREIGYNQPAGVRYPTENPFA